MVHKSNFTALIAGALAISLVLILGIVFVLKKTNEFSIRISSNRTAIEQCRNNQAKCVNGFVQWRTGTIYRVTSGDAEDKRRTIDVKGLVTQMDVWGDKYLEQIETVILPNNSGRQEWDTRYEQQFN